MRLERRTVAGLVAVGLLAGFGLTDPVFAGSKLAGPVVAVPTLKPAKDSGAGRTVTLVTGDRVTVWGEGRVSVDRGAGRDGVTFHMSTDDGRVRVVPGDAAPLLAAGRLDPRLFDVTALLGFGYDRRDYLPLIVTGGAGTSVAATGRSVGAVDGLVKGRDLPAVNGVVVRQSRGEAAESWRALTGGNAATRVLPAGVSKVWLDGQRKPSLDVSVPQIGAPAAWNAGYTGVGSTVAVLDTGVDDSHPDLAGTVVGRQNFTEDVEPDNDVAGHGTHVAATIAGTGAASGGQYKGVAPSAKLLDGKVCVIGGCAESWIVAGMTWAAADQHAKVVNLSLGGPDDPEVVDVLEEAVQTLTERHGTLFVVASGNGDGPSEGVSSPGSADAALTVGAVDSANALAPFSRRGPRDGDDALKPDITAPGVGIMAARGKDATAVPGEPGDRYTRLSGTSMATPHVAGAAAILAQQHPDWTGQQIKAALMATARPTAGTGVYGQGAGRVDVARAVAQAVTTESASISFGRQMWPHDDDRVLTRDVTYHNHGTADVTLSLSLGTFSADGRPTPDGMFTVNADTVRVPAGGEATVSVTADTRVPGPDGHAGGWLTATAGDVVVQTPMALHKEVESYDVTLTHIDRSGAAPELYKTRMWQNDSGRLPFDTGYRFGVDGDTVTLRVPKGSYTVTSFFGPEREKVLLAQPQLDVDRQHTVVLDGRLSKPISITVPEQSARTASVGVGMSARRGTETAGDFVFGTTFEGFYSARIGPDIPDEDFTSGIGGQWAEPNTDGTFDNSPYAYLLSFPQAGRMITGYNRRVVESELARVRVDFARANPTASVGNRRVFGGPVFPADMRFGLPFSRTEYYNSAPGLEWWGHFSEGSEQEYTASYSANSATTYKAGQAYHEVWNKGVFGPALPPRMLFDGVTRSGDSMLVDVPLHSDGLGRAGESTTENFTATLFRNGTKIGETNEPRFWQPDVPAADARYRLELQAQRDPQFELSTKTQIAWEFRSAHVAGTAPATLPLWTIRFTPNLDRYNTAPAGRAVTVPVAAVPQPGAPTGEPTQLTVQVSYDDGVTWTPTPVRDGAAHLQHPPGEGFVSLRATTSDNAGNTTQQTTIHAYRYGTMK